MGLKLGRLLKKVVKVGVPVVGGFLTGGPAGAVLAGGALIQSKAARLTQPVAAGIPSIEQVTGVPAIRFANGAVVPAAAGAIPQVGALGIRLLTQSAARGILKLAQIFGIGVALTNLASVGRRLFRAFRVFARRHPTISIISMLTAMGLTIEEASEFFFWGEATTRRRRGRGISARDIRVCRKTMRRMAAFQRDMFRAAPRRRAGGRGAGAPIIAQN